jgi:hypothetical protein
LGIYPYIGADCFYQGNVNAFLDSGGDARLTCAPTYLAWAKEVHWRKAA